MQKLKAGRKVNVLEAQSHRWEDIFQQPQQPPAQQARRHHQKPLGEDSIRTCQRFVSPTKYVQQMGENCFFFKVIYRMHAPEEPCGAAPKSFFRPDADGSFVPQSRQLAVDQTRLALRFWSDVSSEPTLPDAAQCTNVRSPSEGQKGGRTSPGVCGAKSFNGHAGRAHRAKTTVFAGLDTVVMLLLLKYTRHIYTFKLGD